MSAPERTRAEEKSRDSQASEAMSQLSLLLGARLRGRMATQHSEKGSDQQQPEGLLTEARPHKRVTLIMVGFFTTEATIKIKHFRRDQSAPKERRRRHAEKRSSKRVFLDSPFLLCPLKACS